MAELVLEITLTIGRDKIIHARWQSIRNNEIAGDLPSKQTALLLNIPGHADRKNAKAQCYDTPSAVLRSN